MNLDPGTKAYSHPCDKPAWGRGMGLFICLAVDEAVKGDLLASSE